MSEIYTVWVRILEAEACGYGPGLSDVDLCTLPKQSQERREHDELPSQPTNPPIPGPDIAYRRL